MTLTISPVKLSEMVWHTTHLLSIITAALCLILLPMPSQVCAAPEARIALALKHIPPSFAAAHLIQRLDGTKSLTLSLILPLRNRAVLDEQNRYIFDPHNPMYGQYLTPEQFTVQFGPNQSDVDAVTGFAAAHGLKVKDVSLNHTTIRVAGSARAVESAFGVQFNEYSARDGSRFFAADREPTVTAAMAGHLLGILGLSNNQKAHSFSHRVSASSASINTPLHFRTGNAGLSPSDVKSIYNLTNTPYTGTGQIAGLFEEGTFTASDITMFLQQYNLPNIPINPIAVDGFDTSSSPGDAAAEATLDIDMIAGLAPGISQIRVYEVDPNSPTTFTQQLVDTFNVMANEPVALRPTIVSISYGSLHGEVGIPASDFQSVDQALAQLTRQGQTVCVALGDAGAYTDQNNSDPNDLYSNTPVVSYPASDPQVTCVGGTDLSDVNDTNYNAIYASETSWSCTSDFGRGPIGTGGGGGISFYWPIPSWQVGAIDTAVNPQGSTTMRNLPDVSLYGDYDTGNGYSIYFSDPEHGPDWYGENGTSASAPLWAAFLADVNQARLANGLPMIGLANPAIYQTAESAKYSNDFHDIADGSNNLFYNAVTGYDNSTGWGSFIGANLLADLAIYGQVATPPLVGKKQDSSYDQRYIDCYNRVGPGIVGSVYNNNLVHIVSGAYGNGTAQDFVDGTNTRNIILAKDGTAQAYNIRGSIWTFYSSLGFASSSLGFPNSDVITCNASPQGTTGTQAYFEGGTVYSSSGTVGTHILSGDLLSKYGEIGQSWSGGTSGILGFPATGIFNCNPSPKGTTGTQVLFEGGAIYSGSGNIGIHVVSRAFFNKYADVGQSWSGGTSGILGFPITDIFNSRPSLKGTTGQQLLFEGGGIYSGSGSVGIHVISGAIFNKYAVGGQPWSGGTHGLLGFPTSDEYNAVQPSWGTSGRVSSFEGGVIYNTSTYGAHPVYGAIYNQYAAAGGSGGKYGFPTSDPYLWQNKIRQDFERSFLTASFTTSAHILWNCTDGTVSFWTVNLDGTHPYHLYGPFPGWTANAVADGPNGVTRALWTHPADGQVSLWSLTDNQQTDYHLYGPYPGWTAQALAVGPDNNAHLLWTDPADGLISLWTVDSFGNYAHHEYGPIPGWTATGVSVGPDGMTHVLWRNANGTACTWNVDGSGNWTYALYGPWPGWSPTAISEGPDNTLRLLWSHPADGLTTLEQVTSGGAVSYQQFGPFGGWGASGVTVGSDSQTRILWNRPSDGLMSLEGITSGGGVSYQQFGPFGGWTAVSVAAP